MRTVPPPGTPLPMRLPADETLLRCSLAAVWLATGGLVLHPGYRAAAAPWLQAVHLPDAVMWATCGAEILLGLLLLRPQPPRWVWPLQGAMVLAFTAILVVADPALLAHPLGILTKNIPFLLVVLVLGFRRMPAAGLPVVLRLAAAIPWFTEGLLPKIAFQTPWELALVPRMGFEATSPTVVLTAVGLAQAISGVLALTLRGRALQVLLIGHAAALIVLPVWIGWLEPAWWVHPFGPLTKNLPILAATIVLVRRCSSSS
jgi:hypothetical protein